jgi:hypothetical protein
MIGQIRKTKVAEALVEPKTEEHDTNAGGETMDQVIPRQMRVMDNGTGFGLNYALPEKRATKACLF